MIDLDFLKKRKTSSTLKKWQEKLEQSKQDSGASTDERFWILKKDDKGKGQAIIRFLPLSKPDAEVDPEMFPWVKVLYHNFKGVSGKYYNETSLKTIGRKDPVVDDINPLWKGTEAELAIARERKAKTSYISNILIIKDPANPDNEGKVFLFRYGIKIHEKILGAMFPEDDLAGSNPVDVTDFWEGANFHLKVKQVDKYPNYDDSKFLEPAPLFADTTADDEVNKIWLSQYALLPFIDPANLKTYDELKARYLDVISENDSSNQNAENVTIESQDSSTEEEDGLDLENLYQTASNDVSESSDDLDDMIDNLFDD